MEEATAEGERHQEHVCRWKNQWKRKANSLKEHIVGGEGRWCDPPGNLDGSEMGVPGTVEGKGEAQS